MFCIGVSSRETRGSQTHTKQKLMAQVKPKFCALLLTSVYAKKKAMVTRAPMIIVPRRPQKYLERHM
jgi:hypothetical protein